MALARWLRMLADMGAEVTVIARPQQAPWRRSSAAAATTPAARARPWCCSTWAGRRRAEALALVAQADALIEGNRPGVMERLGLGRSIAPKPTRASFTAA